ncbi:MAG: hypothetical protein ACMXYG_06285 [Candidatus Woesearchaeota archaeon]
MPIIGNKTEFLPSNGIEYWIQEKLENKKKECPLLETKQSFYPVMGLNIGYKKN